MAAQHKPIAAAAAVAALGLIGLGALLLGDDPAPPPRLPASTGAARDPAGDAAASTRAGPGADGPPRDAGRPAPPSGPVQPPPGPPPRAPAGARPGGSRAAGDAGLAPAGVAVRLVVRSVDGEGQPLEGVHVEVRRANGAPLGAITTDAQGTATLAGLPPGAALAGVARHPRSRDAVRFGPVAAPEAGGEAQVELKFLRARTGRLKGRVIDGAGRPVTEAELALTDPMQEGEAVLDALGMRLGPDGSFEAEVAEGRYSVLARGPGFAPSERAYVTIPADGEAPPVELVLLAQGRLAGRVKLPPDLAAARPPPVELVLELTTGTERNPYRRVLRRPLEVDGALRWRVDGCDPGRYRVRLEAAAPGGSRVGPWSVFELPAGASREDVDLVLTELQPALRGTVRDDRGDPVRGARVSVGGLGVEADARGEWSLAGLDPGDLFVEARAPGYVPVQRQVTYEGVLLTVDIVLARTGGLRGVVRTSAGESLGGALVIAAERSDGGVRPHQVQAGPDGRFAFEDLAPGRYALEAGPGANPFDDRFLLEVEVQAGQPAGDVTLVVP